MTLASALHAAAASGLRVAIDDLGAVQRCPLLAEYDRARGRIAVNARIVAALRARHGVRFAGRFVAFAVWHELHHHRAGDCDERAAHDYARSRSGDGATTFEDAVRALIA